MKQKVLLFFACILWAAGFNVAMAQDSPNVTVVENIDSYEGSDPYVFNQADGKVYVRNNVNAYERYGVYEQVSTLKIAGGGDTEIEYIETTPDMQAHPYINTEYIHKANTRIVAEVNLTQNEVKAYEAVFGARRNITNNALIFFSRFSSDDAGCYARATQEMRGSATLPFGEKITIDVTEDVLQVFTEGFDEPYTEIYTEAGFDDGTHPMYIFDLNNGGNLDNSWGFFKLYSFKIYEGEELVMDLKPFVASTGDAGLVDKVSGKRFFAGNGAKFAVSPDGEAAVSAAGITVYEGKMVFNTTDKKLYKYTGGKFVSLGDRTLVPVEYTEYKDMNNWQTNDDHKSVYWPAEGESIIDYEEAEDVNYIDGYSGIGGFEPLMTKIATVPDEDYNFMFDYAGCEYNSWHGVPMHVFISNVYDLWTSESALAPGGNVLATFECPFAGVEEDNSVHVSLDFTAQQEEQTIVAQFGDCDDFKSFWFVFGHLTVSKYEYPEKYPALNPFAPQIELLLPEAEGFAGDVPNPIKAVLDEAIANAKAVLSSEDMAAQKTALEELRDALQFAKDNDLTMLRKVIAAAKADGIDVTEYEAFCEEGTAGTAGQVDQLRSVRKVSHLEKDLNSEWPGHDPVNEGKFYIYNVGTGAYLTNGADWGTHAAIGYPGLEATFYETEGGYNIQFDELIQGDARDRFLGNSGAGPYLDCADGNKSVYTFLPVDGKPGVFNILCADKGYLAFDPTANTDTGWRYYNTITCLWEEPVNEMAEWILVTKDDRLALLDNATAESPVDATVIIRDASFNKFAALDNPWDGINQGWGWGTHYFGDKNTETWNSQEYTLGQPVTFPKKGTYEIKVQAYYRDGDHGAHAESVANGEELMPAPVLFADMDETPIAYIHEGADKAPGEGDDSAIGNIPNSMYQASQFFEYGLYWNTLKIYVEKDNTEIYIGIAKEAGNRDGNWIVADNFRAVYYGPDKEVGIETVKGIETATDDAKIYNVAGQRVSKLQRGVNIIGNKKVVVK